MKKLFKEYVPLTVLSVMSVAVHAQDSTAADTFNLTSGRWTVCTDVKFSIDYKCKNGWTNYTFYADGTYLETQSGSTGHGTYKFKGDSLFIKRNDESFSDGSYTTSEGENFSIRWLDKDRFYNVSKDGPEGIVYTYFERIK